MEYKRNLDNGGVITLGGLEQYDFSKKEVLKEATSISYEKGRYGVGLSTKRKGRGLGFPDSLALSILLKFKFTKLVLKTKFTDLRELSIPKGKIIIHTSLGDNLVIKSEYTYPGEGSLNYFGYSYSPRLHFGIVVKKQEGLEAGFLKKPFFFGLEVNYVD